MRFHGLVGSEAFFLSPPASSVPVTDFIFCSFPTGYRNSDDILGTSYTPVYRYRSPEGEKVYLYLFSPLFAAPTAGSGCSPPLLALREVLGGRCLLSSAGTRLVLLELATFISRRASLPLDRSIAVCFVHKCAGKLRNLRRPGELKTARSESAQGTASIISECESEGRRHAICTPLRIGSSESAVVATR